MDITLDVADYKLNIRAAGVIIHNNKVLVHKSINEDHACLPGGRVTIGESSEETVKRELEEELGKKVEIQKYLTSVENFFQMNQKKYHEIMFVYKVEFEDEEDKKIEQTMKNVEGKDYLYYEWIDIDKIENYRLMPQCFRKMLIEDEWIKNRINID